MIRAHFMHDLEDLQQRLLHLGESVEQAIAAAVWALMRRDAGEAQRVIAGDAQIDRQRYDLEEHALLMIARQQPLAGDLRMVSALMGLAAELERIGDYAEGIAEIVVRTGALSRVELPEAIGQMAQRAREMLRQSLRAVIERDAFAAQRLELLDDEVDALYQQVLQTLIVVMGRGPAMVEPGTYILWAAHNLERIADRTVNIAERAAFIATGLLGARG